MFHIRDESKHLQNGFNFYKLTDKYSFGFILKLRNTAYWCCYSKFVKRWFFRVTKNDPKAYSNLYKE